MRDTFEQARCVLREAAEYIKEHGWTQGSYLAPDGAVCLMGSIAKVMGAWNSNHACPYSAWEWDEDFERERGPAYRLAVSMLQEKVGGHFVTHFNDKVLPSGDKGKERAIRVLLEAAGNP